MRRKASLLAVVVLLFAADTAYFGSRCVAELLRLRGERALFRSDLVRAWTLYGRAIAWGANPGRLEGDKVELLVMSMDQLSAGFRRKTPFSAEGCLDAAFSLLGRRLGAEPFNAYLWSQASDLFLHAADQRRRSELMDLSSLSEDPLDNLLPEERLAVVSLEISTRLEPNNCLYHDLLGQFYMNIGAPERAAPSVRRSIASLPDTRGHTYLDHPDLPDVVLEAVVQGFEDATARPSMIPRGFALGEAARFLSWHLDDRRAATFLRRAIEADPGYPDSHMQLADVSYRLKDYTTAIAEASEADRLNPGTPWPHYTSGLSYVALGRLDSAIAEFQKARDTDPQGLRAYQLLGEAFETVGRVKEAERQFVVAANLNPQAPDAWASLLAFYVRQHEPDNASTACSRLAALRPGDHAYDEQCARFESAP